MSRSQKTWDEGKDAQTLGKLKSQGCHFQIALDLFWMQRRVEARGWSRYLATIALAMYGSWWHEKNKPISNSDAARLHGIGREKAADIYKMLCEEFDLELEPIKKGNSRDAGFIMRGVSRTGHIDDRSVVYVSCARHTTHDESSITTIAFFDRLKLKIKLLAEHLVDIGRFLATNPMQPRSIAIADGFVLLMPPGAVHGQCNGR